jgi:hypothetical protein
VEGQRVRAARHARKHTRRVEVFRRIVPNRCKSQGLSALPATRMS